MEIPEEMMSDTIKAFADYLNYMAKSTNTQSAKGRGKRLLTKDGIKVNVKKKTETIRVLRKKRTKNIFKETTQFEEEVDKETDEGTHDHLTMKLVANVPSVTQYSLDLTKASKASRNEYILQQRPKGLGEGSSVIPETPDDQSDSSVSSLLGSDDEEGFLQTDDEELKDKSDDKKTETDNSDDDVGKKKVEKIQVLALELEKKKPKVPPLRSSQTLSSTEYSNQLLNDNFDILMHDILQDLVKTETQSMVEKKRHHNDEDPPIDAGKDTKKRRQKDYEAYSSKIGKDQAESSKEDKAPSEPSKTEKFWMLKNQFKMMLWML
ncbi:hypothetical protein Tco_0553468 [Tanacetum coccineum]